MSSNSYRQQSPLGSASESVDRFTRADIDHTAVITHTEPCLARVRVDHSAIVADAERRFPCACINQSVTSYPESRLA